MFSELFEDEIYQKDLEIARLKKWVSDLQSGMYVNCVYCGHQYGPADTTPVSMADALKAHVAVCTEHPMAGILLKVRKVETGIRRACDSGMLDSNLERSLREVLRDLEKIV